MHFDPRALPDCTRSITVIGLTGGWTAMTGVDKESLFICSYK